MLEGDALLDGQRVRLGNDGDDVDNLGQLFEDNDIDGLQSIFLFCTVIETRSRRIVSHFSYFRSRLATFNELESSIFQGACPVAYRAQVSVPSRHRKQRRIPNLRVAGGGDEEQAAVNAGILDEAVTHGSQLLAKEGRVLVLDVLNDGLPATNRKAIGSLLLVLLLRTKENKDRSL